MYKVYEKDGKSVSYYRFDSLYEYTNFLTTAPIQYQFEGHLSSAKPDYEFTRTRSFQEAIQLCKYGYHYDYDRFIQLKLQLEKYVKQSKQRARQFNDYIGYVPDVKAYLEGNPLSMLNRKNPIRKKIDVYINTSYSASTSATEIYNRGAITLSLIEILESLKYSVDFHVFELCYTDSEVHYSDFILKPETERLNPQKLYFPLCHPSWVRRLNFRLIEVTPNLSHWWVGRYGSPANIELIRNIINPSKNDIIIPTVGEIGIRGDDIIDDANSMFDYINKSDNHEFVLSRIERKN